ncbi:unnamed protein product [Peniophora sp. CBMAI 1063]|nr:unnamed protein product [Peniophora sp. CBMAI 1063]
MMRYNVVQVAGGTTSSANRLLRDRRSGHKDDSPHNYPVQCSITPHGQRWPGTRSPKSLRAHAHKELCLAAAHTRYITRPVPATRDGGGQEDWPLELVLLCLSHRLTWRLRRNRPCRPSGACVDAGERSTLWACSVVCCQALEVGN